MAELKTNRFFHGGDYNPEQWVEYPEILEEDIRLMKEAKITMVSVGIFNATKYLWTLRGVPCGNCRSPFTPLTADQRRILEEAAERWA